jgi:hypothetical protein
MNAHASAVSFPLRMLLAALLMLAAVLPLLWHGTKWPKIPVHGYSRSAPVSAAQQRSR